MIFAFESRQWGWIFFNGARAQILLIHYIWGFVKMNSSVRQCAHGLNIPNLCIRVLVKPYTSSPSYALRHVRMYHMLSTTATPGYTGTDPTSTLFHATHSPVSLLFSRCKFIRLARLPSENGMPVTTCHGHTRNGRATRTSRVSLWIRDTRHPPATPTRHGHIPSQINA